MTDKSRFCDGDQSWIMNQKWSWSEEHNKWGQFDSPQMNIPSRKSVRNAMIIWIPIIPLLHLTRTSQFKGHPFRQDVDHTLVRWVRIRVLSAETTTLCDGSPGVVELRVVPGNIGGAGDRSWMGSQRSRGYPVIPRSFREGLLGYVLMSCNVLR